MTALRTRWVALLSAALLAAGACSSQQPDPARSGASTPASSSPSAPSSPSARRTPTPKPKPDPKEEEKEKRKPRRAGVSSDPLSGGKMSDNPVIAVKIDNVAAARPQIGLRAADMVVVERVEADLTRLMAIYHSRYPKRVGPVRSARNSDLVLLPMFGRPGLVFSGANGKVLKQVRKAPVRPVQVNDRDPSRVAPHNVIVNLRPISKLDGYGKPKPMGYTFAERSPMWRSAAKDRAFGIEVGVDRFGFRFVDGRYRTSWNGHPNKGGRTGRRVLADNVVRLKVDSHKDTKTTSDLSDVIETVGRGKATVYSGGKRITGTWSRPKKLGPMRLIGKGGKDIPLHPGKTWILLDG